MTPRIKDDDKGEITAEIDGREVRGWSYASEAERRQKMMRAHEFAEGWYQAMKAVEVRSQHRTAEMNADLPEAQRDVMQAKGMI